VRYLYTNEVDIEFIKDEIVETLLLAREYAIDGMVTFLEELVAKNLNEDNVSSLQ